MASQPGYTLDRDESGLTNQERNVRDLLAQGVSQAEAGRRLGLAKQRISQIKKKIAEKTIEAAAAKMAAELDNAEIGERELEVDEAELEVDDK